MKVLFVLFALFALVFSQKHIDTTVVQIAEKVDATSEHFFVSVDYIEDELDDAGKVLAERDIKVALRFDVEEQKQVLVNGVPAVMGYSELQVAAAIVEVQTTGEHVPLPKLYSVSLRLFVGLEIKEDGVTEVVIQERVVGIESSEVWQADVLEQTIIVRKDGKIERLDAIQVSLLRGEPEEKPEEVPEKPEEVAAEPEHEGEHKHPDGEHHHGGHGGHHGGHGGHGGHHGAKPGDSNIAAPEEPSNIIADEEPESPNIFLPKDEAKPSCWDKTKQAFGAALNWFHNLPLYLRVLVSFSAGIVLGLVGISLLKCLSCMCSGKKCKRHTAADNYKENIRVYSLQYSSLPQDEKEAKKKEGSIEMA